MQTYLSTEEVLLIVPPLSEVRDVAARTELFRGCTPALEFLFPGTENYSFLAELLNGHYDVLICRGLLLMQTVFSCFNCNSGCCNVFKYFKILY